MKQTVLLIESEDVKTLLSRQVYVPIVNLIVVRIISITNMDLRNHVTRINNEKIKRG
jgi:hypothetical protein